MPNNGPHGNVDYEQGLQRTPSIMEAQRNLKDQKPGLSYFTKIGRNETQDKLSVMLDEMYSYDGSEEGEVSINKRENSEGEL